MYKNVSKQGVVLFVESKRWKVRISTRVEGEENG